MVITREIHLRTQGHIKDNRLLLAGADKAALPPDARAYGGGRGRPQLYRRGRPGDLPGERGQRDRPFQVTAELLYQPLSYRFVQDMQADGGATAACISGYYASADKTPDRVASIPLIQVK